MNFLNNIHLLLKCILHHFSQTYRLRRAQTKKIRAEEIWSKLNLELAIL